MWRKSNGNASQQQQQQSERATQESAPERRLKRSVKLSWMLLLCGLQCEVCKTRSKSLRGISTRSEIKRFTKRFPVESAARRSLEYRWYGVECREMERILVINIRWGFLVMILLILLHQSLSLSLFSSLFYASGKRDLIEIQFLERESSR